ncbi:UDP-N-acetylglucosamine 1-carboxyvinyltransferase [Candidatus Nomurabacteria bacterium]|nr:UDP-N-acetylglucosamine 1-carboxyvinyltransferase [Candidatus Nomurabacteria bacterium]
MTKDKFLIKGLAGEKKLNGKIVVGGAKNAILPVMSSAVLFSDEVKFENVPDIEDVKRMSELLEKLGAKTKKVSKHSWKIDAKKIKSSELDYEISKRLRAAVILIGPRLARYGSVDFPHPGGCVIGARPIDIFLEAFKKMGAKVAVEEKKYHIEVAKGKKLKGAEIFFKIQSVTATETVMMAGVLAEGKTVIRNAAIEPEIVSLAEYLVSCGAKITGAGTLTIEIIGGELLKSEGRIYKTIPDRIEAGSFLILGALCANNLEIKNCRPNDLNILIESLKDSGVPIEVGNDFIKIKKNKSVQNSSFKSFNVKTHEYPGFPTDLQAPISIFLTQATGESIIFETIFENRLNYIQDVIKMGANVKIWDTHRMMITGPTALKGKELDGPDIRAGLAYIIASLVADGESVINNIYYIDRGYESIENRLRTIGADIKRIKE